LGPKLNVAVDVGRVVVVVEVVEVVEVDVDDVEVVEEEVDVVWTLVVYRYTPAMAAITMMTITIVASVVETALFLSRMK